MRGSRSAGLGAASGGIQAVGIAYVGVIATWGSSPLAIKWSGEGVGFLFGATARVVLAWLFAWLICLIIGLRVRTDRPALINYLIGGLGIYGTTLALYWGAQFVPSGWVAVLLSATPFVSALLGHLVLAERLGGFSRWLGMGIALSGIVLIFLRGYALHELAGLAVASVLLGTLFHSASMVWIKRLDAGVPALALVAGSLGCAAIPLLFTWSGFDGRWPVAISPKTMVAILYAALFSTVLGLALYLYVLRRLGPTRVAFVMFVTPVFALLVGHWINGEVIDGRIWLGAALVISGLGLFEGPLSFSLASITAGRQAHESE